VHHERQDHTRSAPSSFDFASTILATELGCSSTEAS